MTSDDSVLTNNMNNFRRASRELFNNFFRPSDGDNYKAWLEVESFRKVEKVLFDQLVIQPSEIESVEYRDQQSQIEAICRHGDAMPVLIYREIECDWEHPVKQIGQDARLQFIEFWDFESPGICIDNQYVKVRITEHQTRPELNGDVALILSFYVAYKVVNKKDLATE